VPVPACHRFNDKVALVSAGAHGIGAAIVRRLHAEGCTVVVADIDGDAGSALAAELGPRVRFTRCDVACPQDWTRAVTVATELGGGLDVLVSNAAFQPPPTPAHEMSPQTWNQVLAVGLTGTFHGVRACLPSLRGRDGAVVITSSVHALVGLRGHPAYAAVKGGLTALTRQLAAEYGPGLRVNAVLPGPIRTRAWDGIEEEVQRASARETVLGRLGDPAEVAAAVSFLACADASFVTGTSLVVDGGWSITKASA
jgi:NAD(P)-dependent dehydrogenase (short-subunit alcohol dehydrogenase family)